MRGSGDPREGREILRTPLIAAAIIAALLLAPAVAYATHSDGEGPPQDVAAGAGTFAFHGFHFSLSAHSGPSGVNPHGNMVLQTPARLVKAAVRCVQVDGNTARVSGVVTHQKGPNEQGYVLMIVTDTPGPEPDLITTTSFLGPPSEALAATACLFPGVGLDPLLEGNVVVHDAAP